MRSKELKIYNIPKENLPLHTMGVKPRQAILFFLLVGIGITAFYPMYMTLGLSFIAVCLFALVAMPDRRLLDIYESFIIIYDSRILNMCYCIYWEDILTWQYIRKVEGDQLQLELVDGQLVTCDAYRSRKLFLYLQTLARGKEKKVIRKRSK